MSNSFEYDSYMNSPEWQEKRREVLEAAGFKCERCGTTENLTVHHLNYENLGDEDLADLEVLCTDCHPEADRDRESRVEDERLEREEEFEEERWNRRIEGWADARFDYDWPERYSWEEIEHGFILFLQEEGKEIPQEKLLYSTPTYLNKEILKPALAEVTPVKTGMANDEHHQSLSISLTGASDFDRCHYKFFKSYLETPRQTPKRRNADLVFSDCVRSYLNEKIESLVEPTNGIIPEGDITLVDELKARLKEVFYEDHKPRSDIRFVGRKSFNLFKLHAEDIRRYMRSFQARQLVGRRVLEVRRRITINDEGTTIPGTIDLLTEEKNGSLMITIWKTGDRKSFRDFRLEYRRRAWLAMHDISTRYETTNLSSRAVFIRDGGGVDKINFNPDEARKTISYLKDQLNKAKTNDLFKPEKNKLCDWCQWRESCPVFLK